MLIDIWPNNKILSHRSLITVTIYNYSNQSNQHSTYIILLGKVLYEIGFNEVSSSSVKNSIYGQEILDFCPQKDVTDVRRKNSLM